MNQTHTVTDYSAYRFLIVDDKWFLRNLIEGMLFRCRASAVLQAMHGAAASRILDDTAARSTACYATGIWRR